MLAEIDLAEEQWRAQHITHYQVDFYFFTYGIEISGTLVIEGEQIVKASCKVGPMFDAHNPGQCASFESNPEQYTVPGMFKTARSLLGAASNYDPVWKEDIITITLDPTYHYLTRMVWHPPEYSEWAVSVTLFQ